MVLGVTKEEGTKGASSEGLVLGVDLQTISLILQGISFYRSYT